VGERGRRETGVGGMENSIMKYNETNINGKLEAIYNNVKISVQTTLKIHTINHGLIKAALNL
jgi:hypothetical protein